MLYAVRLWLSVILSPIDFLSWLLPEHDYSKEQLVCVCVCVYVHVHMCAGRAFCVCVRMRACACVVLSPQSPPVSCVYLILHASRLV